MAVMMVLSLVTVPVMAETPAANDPRLSTAPKTGTAAAPADAANLNEALNVAGGTLTFTSEGDHPWIVTAMLQRAPTSTSQTPPPRFPPRLPRQQVTSSSSTLCLSAKASATPFGMASSSSLTVPKTMKWNRVETWTTYAVELTAGEHTVSWTYKKDSSFDKPGDYATVDNVYVGAPVTPTQSMLKQFPSPQAAGQLFPTPFSPQKRSTRTLPSAPQTPRSQPLTKTALLSALRKAPPPLP